MNTRNLIIVSKDVGYIPTIDAPATELSTVYEIMNQSNLMMEQLHLERIVVVMDQALYAKLLRLLGNTERNMQGLFYAWALFIP